MKRTLLAIIILTMSLCLMVSADQMEGKWGEPGKQYEMGRDGHEMLFTLAGARFTVDRVFLGDKIFYPEVDEKLLVVYYSIQNPLSKESETLGHHTFKFTVVDESNSNHEGCRETGLKISGDDVNGEMKLKPAQRIKLYKVFVVPAAGQVPKLIVSRDRNTPVLRYDLRKVVGPLEAPYADTDDATGFTAAEEIPASVGNTVQLGHWDVTPVSAEIVTGEFGKRPPKDGYGFLVVKMNVKNVDSEEHGLYKNTLHFDLEDGDGIKLKRKMDIMHPSRDETYKPKVDSGEEVTVRYYFDYPLNYNEGSLAVKLNKKSREFVFNVSDLLSR